MANSIQTYNSDHIIIDDDDLNYIIRMFLEEVESNPKRYHLLLDHTVLWNDTVENYTVGCIRLELDKLPKDEMAIAQFRNLISAADKRVDSFGDYIDADFLNENWSLSGVKHAGKYPVKDIRSAIDKLGKLLN
ncbi:MAG: hypothetical protein AAFY34_12250 [Pseudomonadota bacterium]